MNRDRFGGRQGRGDPPPYWRHRHVPKIAPQARAGRLAPLGLAVAIGVGLAWGLVQALVR